MSGAHVLRPGPAAYVWVTVAVAASTWLSLVVQNPLTEPAPEWAALPATIFGLAVFWRTRHLPRDVRFLSLLPTFYVAFVVGALAAGTSLGRAAWMSLVNVAVAVSASWGYRRKNSSDDWAPGNASDAVLCLVIYAVAAAVLTVLAGIPRDDLLRLDDLAFLDAMSRAQGGLTGYLAPALVFLASVRRSATESRFRLTDVPLAALAITCAVLPYLVPQYPMSWTLFVPALWLGLTFPPKVTAPLGAAGVLVSVLGTSAPYWRTVVDLGLPPYLHTRSAAFVAAALALVISYQREDKARLSNRLTSQRIRAATDNAILDGMFRAMHDGVIVADPDGVVVMSNQAGRSMLRLPRAEATPQRLFDVLGTLQNAGSTGSIPPSDLQRFVSQARPGSLHACVADEGNGPRRWLSLASLPLSLSDRPHRLILIRDTSVLHECHHRLKAFARTVAQELSKPLESLTESIGVTQDLLWDENRLGAKTALGNTIRSAMRIRPLIDDHVAATLAREGVLRPSTVHLAPLVSDAVWACERNGITVDVQAPHAVFADLTLTRQLLNNLIQSAVERAQEGQHAAVRIVSEPADETGWLNVTVTDRDEGPPSYAEPRRPAPQDETAEAFSSDPRLALCHTIVTRHGGQFAAAPNALGGATITLTLPSV